ncbi:MAG: hypothetical protein NT045_00840 [Candidatus Aureabacteria bacterium]|nr:hypothetical protein [Candidatus Auribacterota bacterium]
MDALLNALTINVTDFFRDTKAFDALAGRVIPELFPAGSSPARPVRVWSCGCSAGQEALSVLMLIAEHH